MELEPALFRIGNKLPSSTEPPEVFRPIRVTIRASQMKYPLRTHISANHSTSLCQLKLTLALTFHDRLQKRVRTLLHLNPAEKTFRFRLTEADVGSSYSGRVELPLRIMMYSIQQQTLAILSLDDDTQRNTPSKDPFYFAEQNKSLLS